jgi:hypothetical protein
MNKIGMILIGTLLYILSSFFAYSFFSSQGATFHSPISYKAPSNGVGPTVDNSEPKTEECPLNGEMLTKTQKTAWLKRRPMAIMIENHKEAKMCTCPLWR